MVNARQPAKAIVVATTAMLIAVSTASADDHRSMPFQGTYGMTATGACLSSPAGFYPNHVAIEPSAHNAAVNTGVLRFERDGTGSAKVRQTQLNFPPASAAYAGSADIAFDFTYTVSQDGSVTLDMLLNTYKATYLTGPLASVSVTFVTSPDLSPIWRWSGPLSQDRKTMFLNSGDTVSRLRLSNGAEVGVICQFARVLTRLGP
jgi:hypothetical protein